MQKGKKRKERKKEFINIAVDFHDIVLLFQTIKQNV